MTHDTGKSYEAGDVQWIADNWAQARPTIVAFIRSAIRDTHTAEDLVQDVARAVVEGFNAENPPQSFTAWTMGIARHKVADHIRASSREKQVFAGNLLEELADAHVELHDQREDRLEALDHCMQRLQQRAQIAINLRYNRDMTMREVGEHLAITDRAASALLQRARQSLLECIEQRLEAEERR